MKNTKDLKKVSNVLTSSEIELLNHTVHVLHELYPTLDGIYHHGHQT